MTVLIVAAPSSAIAQALSYSGSLQASSGDYIFTERTHSLYLNTGLTAEIGPATASISVPVIYQTSPWISYTVAGVIPSGGTDQVSVRTRRSGSGSGTGGQNGGRASKTFELVTGVDESDDITPADTVAYSELGLGDPSIDVTLNILGLDGRGPALHVCATVKTPVADVDRGFGTGAWDAGFGVGVSQRFGRVFAFANAEYWFFGDMADLPLNNALSYGIAAGVPIVAGKLTALGSLSGFTRIIEDVDPPMQLGLGVNYALAPTHSLSMTTAVGLTEGTSDYQIGVGWSVGF